MVSLVVGFPGSGKSYYAIDKIVNVLENKDKLSQELEVIYTNINGVKFEEFPQSTIKFKKLNIEDFFAYLTACYSLYELHKNEDSVDDYLVKFSKEKGYYKTYIIFDECHDFFTPQDKVKIFWLTYHRHLFHEIILLTQNKSLIHSKYRAIPEIFIEAQPRSKKLSNSSLTYKSYASFAMRKSDMFDKFSVKTKSEVFALYQSGNKSNQKSILVKFIGYLVVGIIIAALLFYKLMAGFTEEDEIITPISKTPLKPIQNQNSINDVEAHNNYISDDYFTMFILCDSLKGCKVYNNLYRYRYIRLFLSKTDSKLLYRNVLYSKGNHTIFRQLLLTSKEDLKQYFEVEFDDIRKENPNILSNIINENEVLK